MWDCDSQGAFLSAKQKLGGGSGLVQYYHSSRTGQLLGLAIVPRSAGTEEPQQHHLHLMQTRSRLQPADAAPRMALVKLCY